MISAGVVALKALTIRDFDSGYKKGRYLARKTAKDR
jgi:hypothetical protein